MGYGEASCQCVNFLKYKQREFERGSENLKIYKWLVTGTLAFFLLSTLLTGAGVLASPLDDLKKEKKEIELKQNELQSDINVKSKEITTKRTKVEQIQDKIVALNAQIEETNGSIERVESKINQTVQEINALKKSIIELEKKIEERDVVLRERIRAMQVKGSSVNYVDVLLGANSFSDFIDRFSAVNTLMDADRGIMDQQAKDIEQLETEKELVEKKRAEQEENKKYLQRMKASLETKRVEMNKLIDQLESEQARLEKEKGSLEENLDEAHEISAELEQKIVKEQKRIAELARKAEAERKRKAAAAAAAAQQSSGGGGGSSSSLPVVSSGNWTKPAVGRNTSSFGWRNHPIYHTQRQHRGADIANSTGTPVVAAGNGIVSYAGPMSTLGNFITVTHSIDGQIFTTAYAHLSQISVSVGQSVDKGQYIGNIGTTGASTGPHLHFEFHIGSWSASGPSAVNPLRYVSF